MKPLNKIVYHKGDVITAALSGDYDIFMQGCNCIGIMNGGVALQVRHRIPELYQADQEFEIASNDRLGLCSSVVVKGTVMINLYTQFIPDSSSRQLNYGSLASSLTYGFVSYINRLDIILEKPVKICIPRIGCGLAGGDWEIVEEILGYLDLDWNVEFHVYDYEG